MAESLAPSDSYTATATATGRKQPTAGRANRGQATLNRTASAPAGLTADRNAAREQEQEQVDEEERPVPPKRGRPPKSKLSAASKSSGKRPEPKKSQASKPSKLPQPADSGSDSELEPEDEEEFGTAESIAAGHAALTAKQKRKRTGRNSSALPPLKRRKTML